MLQCRLPCWLTPSSLPDPDACPAQELYRFVSEHAHVARHSPGQLTVVLISGDEDFLEPVQVGDAHSGFFSRRCISGSPPNSHPHFPIVTPPSRDLNQRAPACFTLHVNIVSAATFSSAPSTTITIPAPTRVRVHCDCVSRFVFSQFIFLPRPRLQVALNSGFSVELMHHEQPSWALRSQQGYAREPLLWTDFLKQRSGASHVNLPYNKNQKKSK
jgi:hypothetical protein